MVTHRCFAMLTGLAHLKHYLPENVLSTLVSALVLSHVRYCLTVYGNGADKNLNRIQKILDFCARVISGRKKYGHILDVQRRIGWLPRAGMGWRASHTPLRDRLCSKVQRQFAYRAVKSYNGLPTIVTGRPAPSVQHALQCHLAASAPHD